MATNGTTDPAAVERAISAMSALASRIELAQRLGYAYSGNRDVYEALGWPKTIQLNDLTLRYERQDIAGRVVDLPANATWREGFDVRDGSPHQRAHRFPEGGTTEDETPFEEGWRALDKRLQVQANMQRLDRLSGLHEYACLFLGVRGQQPETPMRRVSRGPDDLLHLSVFTQPNADVDSLDADPASVRFGLPAMYALQVMQRTSAGASGSSAIGGGLLTTGPTISAHHSRIIHAAEGLDETKIYGRPRLLRVYNLLFALELVVGAAAEGFWRSGARARFHANAIPEMSGQISADELTELGDQVAKFAHGMQDWLRTSGMEVTQFQATTGDPRGPAEVILDLIAAASDIPKRILLGSERGELASSQDATEWAHRIDERQRNHVEPSIVRPFIDRMIDANVLPPPLGGEYEIVWPDLTGPSVVQRAELVDRIAAAEMKHAQAKMLGVRLVTENEMREALGYEPVDELDDDLSDDEPEPEPQKPEQPDNPPSPSDEDEMAKQSLAVQYASDQPRDPAGTPTGGQWTSGGGGGVSLSPTTERAFSGQAVELETKLSKQEAGALGEAVVVEHLKAQGYEDAAALNMKQSNFPVDLAQDHELIEVKTGLVSNGKSAQQWRATIGQPGKGEREWLKTASTADKKTWNAEKSSAILNRKAAVLKDWSRQHGVEAKGKTITTIINPDTKVVDVFVFDGFHLRIGWKSAAAEAAYVGSYTYG